MSKQVKQIRATQAELDILMVANGQIVKNDDDNTLHVGDGVKIGGEKLLNHPVASQFFNGTANLLQNHNFVIPGTVANPPSATPEDHDAGNEVFAGWVVSTGGITGLTYVGGQVNFATGSFEQKVPKSGALEFMTEFSAWAKSVSGPITDTGIAWQLVGDEFIITVSAAAGDVFAVKFKEGLQADAIEIFSSVDDNPYTMTLEQAISNPYAKEGDYKEISDRIAKFQYVTGETADTFSIIQCDNQALQLKLVHSWFVLDVNFGCPKDGATDGSPATQAALDYVSANKGLLTTVITMPGATSLESPIKWPKGVNWVGTSTLGGADGGCEYVCNFSPATIANPPTDNYAGSRFSPTLDWPPMIYNTELITQQKIGGFRLNGNDKDAYGYYLNEWYYVEMEPIFNIKFNKSPFTALVGQFNNIKMLTCNVNKAGVRIIGCSSTEIEKLDTENNLITSGSQLDIIQDLSVKATVRVGIWHYEESAANFPGKIARISGRNVSIDGANLAMAGANPARYIELLGIESYSFDGITFNTIAAIGPSLDDVSFSTGASSVQLNSGCVGAYINVNDVSSVIDNSGSVTNQIDGFTSAQRLPRGATIKNGSGGNMLSFPDDNTLRLFDNANRNIKKAGSKLVIENTAGDIELALGGGNNAIQNYSNGGTMQLNGIPTSAAGLASGEVWNNSGVLTII